MMFRATIVLSALMAANAFMMPSPAFVKQQPLKMTAETHIDKNYMAGSGMTVEQIPLFIEKLSADNFDETLEMLEPLILNECVGDICDDYVGMLASKCESIGKKLPKGYANSHH